MFLVIYWMTMIKVKYRKNQGNQMNQTNHSSDNVALVWRTDNRNY